MLQSVYEETERKMGEAVRSVQKDFQTVRTGRASSAMVEGIKVDYYGSPTPVNQLAKIQVPDPKQIIIQPYDNDNLPDIEKAILASDLDLTPNSDGEIIRIQIPDLTEERRQELSSVVKEYAEEGKISIRQIRREAREEIDFYAEEGEISEDDAYRAKEKIQDLTDEHESRIDELLEKKQNELTTV